MLSLHKLKKLKLILLSVNGLKKLYSDIKLAQQLVLLATTHPKRDLLTIQFVVIFTDASWAELFSDVLKLLLLIRLTNTLIIQSFTFLFIII